MRKVNIAVLLIVFTVVMSSSCAKPAAKRGTKEAVSAKARTSQPGGILEATQFHGSLIGMQYEPWFTPKNAGWQTAEAIPILGKYSSYNTTILTKHAEWFESLGINWILIDWSNMLWMSPPWEEHKGATRQLEQTTELLFKTYHQLQEKGQTPPKIVFLLGLFNGPPVMHGVQRLEGIFHWLGAHLLSNPDYKNLWLYVHGKPLITIIYNTADPCRQLPQALKAHPLHEPDWTIRWMASQLQVNHAESCGMWSWMDGTIQQKVTYHAGKPEETVVTPSCFGPGGWLAPTATGRDHGAPYLKSWEVAFKTRPKFIQIHQWNEFAGQAKGKGYGPEHHVYVDEYNLPFSDDLEPTQLHGCAYRGCGGWGYYYMNLTKALISLYRGETPNITVMALSWPFEAGPVRSAKLSLSWITLGRSPTGYSLELDGKTVASDIHGNNYTLDLSHVSHGAHQIMLIAHGAHTYFDLNANAVTEESPMSLPVTSTIDFQYEPRS